MPSGKIDDNAAIRERLSELCEQHSQSEVARKVGTSPANISRYLRGNRIPAELCSKLVRELGVNPSWLMVGEGAPLLSDVTQDTAKLGGGVLELIEALNAVTRMRLGALTGQHHLRVLRELNEAMKRYEQLREKLNTQSVPIFERLIHEFRDAIAARDLDRAADLREACAQVARLCDAEDLVTDFEAAQGHFEYLQLHPERAIEHQSRVYIRRLLKAGEFGTEGLIQAHNYALILSHVGRREEARRIARSALELAGEVDWQLMVVAATLDVELGDLERGLNTLRRAIPRVRLDYRQNPEMTLARASLLEGSMTLEQALQFAPRDTDAKWSRLLSFAMLMEDRDGLEMLLPMAVGDRPQKLPADSTHVLAARGVLNPSVTAARTFLKAAETNDRRQPVQRFEHDTVAAQLFRLAGRRKEALEFAMQAEEARQPGIDSPLEWRIVQARNLLSLLKPSERATKKRAARKSAEEFVTSYHTRGYTCLTPLLDLI